MAATFVLAVAAILFFDRAALMPGVAAGLFIAILAVFFFSLTMQPQTPAVSFAQLIKKQMVWSILVRIPLMCVVFCLALFWLKLNAVGLLGGMALGVFVYMVFGFIRLFQARSEMAGN